MGQEGFSLKRGGGGGGGGGSLPVAGSRPGHRPSRGRQIQKTFNNLKITLLCGFVTILVLRGTIGVGPLSTSPTSSAASSSSSDPAADALRIIEETNRILAEIRAGDADDDDDLPSPDSSNSTAEYRLGPKITDWDDQRRRWLAANPGFPAAVAGGKPRILLLTGSAPSPCDNPIGDHYLLKAVKNKMDYCRLHGIEIVYNLAHLDKELAGYWAKLPMIRRLMLSHPEVEWIWWMDSDALFTDMDFEIPHRKYKSSNLVIHGYQDLLYEKHSWIALNTDPKIDK